MRLHALILALFVLGAYSASIPDKKDIEKKLAAVVKEVLNKDEVPVDNVSSEQELIEPTNGIKDLENNLKKSALPSDIPVKVVVENVQPVLKTDDKKEDNEVSPVSEESDEIVREEIDLKNPGPPQRMQHDTQAAPEHIPDAQQITTLKNSEWRGSPQYAAIQKELKEMKDSFENKMAELYGFLQAHWSTHSPEKEEELIKVRASVKEEASSTTSGSSGSPSSGTSNSTSSGPFNGFFQNFVEQFQQNFNNMNQTINQYWNNSTNSNSTSNGCNSGNNLFNWGNNNQQQQSDEPARPGGGIWQNIQNFVQNAIPSNTPAGAQSDSEQSPQPNRPVINAWNSALNTLFSRPGQSEQQQQPQQPIQATTQEGANAVPAESKPEGENQKQKPEQAPVAALPSGPITQMIGNNPVVQGLAGAVQRIQHAIIPTKPRNEEIKSADKEVEATKGGLFLPPPKPPHRPGSGDNNDVSGSGVDVKPEESQVKEEVAEPTKEEKAPEVQKTE